MLNKDDLHFIRLIGQGGLMPPVLSPGPLGVGIQQPQALSPRAASEIYASLAGYGFTGFQIIPGGAQLATADMACILVLTGAGWQFTEDLTRTTFEHSLDKMDVAVRDFASKLPSGTVQIQQIVNLEAVWDNVGASSTEYIGKRFLTPQVYTVAENLVEGQTLLGTGFRVVVQRQSSDPLPPGMTIANPAGALDIFDVKAETFLQDPAKLFVTAIGTYGPSVDFTVVGRRAREVYQILWDKFAANMTFGS